MSILVSSTAAVLMRKIKPYLFKSSVKLGFLSLTAKPNPDKHGLVELVEGFIIIP